MSPQVEFLWVAGIIIIAFLVWFNAAKTQQREREANAKLDEIKQLLSKSGTTLEDVERVIGDQAHFEGRV